MALTGFLAGFNEQREAEQKLESDRVLSEYRASETLKNLEQIQRDNAWKSGLAAIMTEDPNSAAGPGVNLPAPPVPPQPKTRLEPDPITPEESVEVTEPVPPAAMEDYVRQQQTYQQRVQDAQQRAREVARANRLDRAAEWTMNFDPSKAVGMHSLAANMRAKHSHIDAEQERMRGEQQKNEAARRDAQAAALGAIDSQANYREGYQEYINRGGPPIPGLTGIWEKDKALIQYHANAGMKVADQNRAETARANQISQAAQRESQAERARVAAVQAAAELDRKRDADEVRKRESEARIAKADADAKVAQDRLNQAKVVGKEDLDKVSAQFDSMMSGMQDPPKFDANARRDIVGRAAIRAKKRIKDGDKRDFADVADEELRGELTMWRQQRMWAFPDWMGGGKIEPSPWIPGYTKPPAPHLTNPHSTSMEEELRRHNTPTPAATPTPNPVPPQPTPRPPAASAAQPTATPAPAPSSRGPTRGLAQALDYYHVNKHLDPSLRELFKEEYGFYPD